MSPPVCGYRSLHSAVGSNTTFHAYGCIVFQTSSAYIRHSQLISPTWCRSPPFPARRGGARELYKSPQLPATSSSPHRSLSQTCWQHSRYLTGSYLCKWRRPLLECQRQAPTVSHSYWMGGGGGGGPGPSTQGYTELHIYDHFPPLMLAHHWVTVPTPDASPPLFPDSSIIKLHQARMETNCWSFLEHPSQTCTSSRQRLTRIFFFIFFQRIRCFIQVLRLWFLA